MSKYVNDNGVSEMWLNIKNWVTSQLLGYSQTGHTHSASDITSGLSNVATSGSYNDLSNKPTIPTVNNATLKIQKNGTDVKTFTANASTDVTCNITVPTKVSELSNDSGFLTSHQSLSNYVTSSNLSTALSDKVDRIDHGYKQITGNGTYSWCKLATITIKGGYINNPISFEIDGRGRERSILQVLFANVSDNDPSLTSFKSDLDTNFYIKKVATSTWELYGNYSEAWGSFTLYRVTSNINSNSVAIDTTLSNLSSAPSGTTRVSPSITVPTKVSQLTNDSGFLTSHQSLSDYSTKANTVKSLSISGKTITVTPGSGSAYTLTTQDTTYTHPTSSGNKHIPSGGSSGQFLGWSADGTAKWVNNPNTNTWTAMVGATSSSNGSVGYVNAVPPKDGYNTKYLRADGTWQVPPDHTYTVNNATLTIQKNGTTVKTFTANASSNVTCNITVPTKTSELTNNSGFLTSHQSLSSRVPVSGGNVMTGTSLGRNTNTSLFRLDGGETWDDGASLTLYGGTQSELPGSISLHTQHSSTGSKLMWLHPSGTWIWDGTAVQITSDQRLKQQISKIDNALLDAWEDVTPCQFKYNDAVNEKGDNARLHTGYVVQQINEACQKHDVDISSYGLYCHEEYAEETEEVEVEQKDGTKTKERKVIREASEHYSLRYTEVYAVECMYLRCCIARLTARIEELEKGNNVK